MNKITSMHMYKTADEQLFFFQQVYDVSEFVHKHPGGIDQIMLGAGRDITQLFQCYHKLETAK